MARKASGSKPKPKAAPKVGRPKKDDGEKKSGLALVRAEFGDGVVTKASEIVEAAREVISTGSPAIDDGTGGGVLAGTIVTLTGPAGCGKTTTGLEICESWQKLKRKVYIGATEWRLFRRDLENISGLDPSLVEVIRSYEGHHLSAQDFLKAADILLSNDRNILFFMDSFSMIADRGELDSDDYAQGAPATVNRMVSTFAKRMTPVVPLNNNLLIGTFHTYANIAGMTNFKGSVPSKMEFARSTGLYCKFATVLKKGEKDDAEGYGQDVHWTVERSMLPGGCTGNAVTSRITYGKGIDASLEWAEIGRGLGLVTKPPKSGRFVLEFTPEKKSLNGETALSDYLDENPEVLQVLVDKIRELRGA